MTHKQPGLSLGDIQRDWRLLDGTAFVPSDEVRLISHERFSGSCGNAVEYLAPGRLVSLLKFWRPLFSCAYAWRLLRFCRPGTLLIVNGGSGLWMFVGILNRVFFRRKVLCWDVFVETNAKWKRAIFRLAIKGITLSVLWSRAQIEPHATFLSVPEERFIFLPFKANHSKHPRYDLQIGNFIFAGGNGKRDYRCLVDAVRGTGIPVIISTTDRKVRETIDPLPNVIVLAASEPAFAQLQAASKFVVIPMTFTGLKGGGEANFCNAMWHGKPVIAADSIAASDYIVEGQTGFVVPSGDSHQLRHRILTLWNDSELTLKMGKAARCHVDAGFTHDAFIRRLLRLAYCLFESGPP